MEDRARVHVGLPVEHPTTSYWQDPPDSIADLCSTEALPGHADYVIIGSGISGASVAYFLIKKKPDAKVVMLEARQACSGATGRNGGHIKGASYRTFMHERDVLGIGEATRIAKLEYANAQATYSLAIELDIDCDITASETVDIIYDQAQLDAATETIHYMNAHIDGDIERYTLLSAAEAQHRFLCPNALGAITYAAGSVSAYKLTIGILKSCLALGLNLQTNTPVTSIPALSEGRHIITPRGTIQAHKTILATNGYTAHLQKCFQGIIVPLRGQISAQRPGSGLPLPLLSTYTFSYENGYEYMIPRPAGSKHAGDIVIGGGWAMLPDAGQSEFGETDDSVVNPAVSKYLTECTETYFGAENWDEDHRDGRVRKEWTGIMGTSADGLPYVGEVPSKSARSNLWASASFNGHGMVLCMKSAEALVTMMEGDAEEKARLNEWFPRSVRMSEERFARKFEGRRNTKPTSGPAKALEERSQLRAE